MCHMIVRGGFPAGSWVGVGLLRVCPRERGRFGKVGLGLVCVRSFRIMDWLSWRLPRFGLITCAEHVREAVLSWVLM